MIWDKLIGHLFGTGTLQHLENFGHYIVQRTQLIYKKVNSDPSNSLNHIYKRRFLKYLETNILNISEDDPSDSTIKQYFAKDIGWVQDIQKGELFCNSSAKFFEKSFTGFLNDPVIKENE
jgi:hypothetical protein